MTANLDKVKPALDSLKQEIAKVIIGQEDAIEQCLIVLLTGAHALIEGTDAQRLPRCGREEDGADLVV